VSAIVTQNIDGLHQAAGSRTVRELHGRVCSLRCDAAHRRPTAETLDRIARGEVPRCPVCGRPQRPDVVLFEEPLDPGTWRTSWADVQGCDGLLIVGTSLQVAPAADLPRLALGRVPVVVVNREPTPIDAGALVLRGDAGAILPALAEGLGGSTGAGLDLHPAPEARHGGTP
jgi:NAD-dependent deacetylase